LRPRAAVWSLAGSKASTPSLDEVADSGLFDPDLSPDSNPSLDEVADSGLFDPDLSPDSNRRDPSASDELVGARAAASEHFAQPVDIFELHLILLFAAKLL
jgi:hypothetical protein